MEGQYIKSAEVRLAANKRWEERMVERTPRVRRALGVSTTGAQERQHKHLEYGKKKICVHEGRLFKIIKRSITYTESNPGLTLS